MPVDDPEGGEDSHDHGAALVAVELRRHLRDHQSEGIPFRGLRGAPMLRRDQFYSSGWKPALVAAGLAGDRFVFHACRHWCASTLLAEGAPLTAVAGHLGDTVETVSRTYVHWLRDDRGVPAEILDRMLGPASRPRPLATGAGEWLAPSLVSGVLTVSRSVSRIRPALAPMPNPRSWPVQRPGKRRPEASRRVRSLRTLLRTG